MEAFMKKRLLAFTSALVLLIASLTGCGGGEGAKDSGDTPEKTMTDVTLNEVAHSIFYAPMYVAIEEGYFAQEGINLTLVTGFGAI